MWSVRGARVGPSEPEDRGSARAGESPDPGDQLVPGEALTRGEQLVPGNQLTPGEALTRGEQLVPGEPLDPLDPG